MIHDLVGLQTIVLHIFRHEGPQKVIARRIFLFILNPAALFQRSLDIAVATLDDEHFCVSVDSVSLFPLLNVSDV